MQHFFFEQIDSWFFRESRSMDGSGSTALASIFPPSSNTLVGALRSLIGKRFLAATDSNWLEYHNAHKSGNPHDLEKIIGYEDQYADLKTQGVWLYNIKEKQLYFPCPLHVLQQNLLDKNGKIVDAKPTFGFFHVQRDKGIQCDLGKKVCLPALDYRLGQSSMEEVLISASQLQKVLTGIPPQKILFLSDILTTDSRLGIACENKSRKTQDGKLYQTNHLRLKDDWRLYLGIDGIAEDDFQYLPQQDLIRLGGEARLASMQQVEEDKNLQLPTAPEILQKPSGLVLTLLSPLPFIEQDNLPALPCSGFQKEEKETTVWTKLLDGIKLEVASAVVGKVQRIGGWNMVKHQSFPVRSFLPAGSCWYLNVQDIEQAKAITVKLHGKFLTDGKDRALGYGQVAVGLEPAIPVNQNKGEGI